MRLSLARSLAPVATFGVSVLVAACSGDTTPAPTPVTVPVPMPVAVPVPQPVPVPPPPPAVEGSCEVSEPAVATRTDELLGIVSVLSEALADEALGGGPTPSTAFEARTALCPQGCDSTQPFVTPFTRSPDRAYAHLVVPRTGGGFFVVPELSRGHGGASRCGDTMRGVTREDGELVRLHLTVLVNDLVLCDRDGDGEPDVIEDEADRAGCPSGCALRERIDRELVIDPESGRYVVVSSASAITEEAGEGEGAERLATDAVRVEGTTAIVRCPDERRVELADPVDAAIRSDDPPSR